MSPAIGRVETCPNEQFSTAGGGDSDRATGSFFKGNDVMDLSKLNDEEIKLLERLMLKAAGQLDGAVVAPFVVEFINGNTIENDTDAN